ncbi:hypothetical protein BV20DRAFT_1056366 [Pilatotrama ljubarskyi]|nr:hypothetical protein BV20DRAFT_1056366 [Pilatotrama ljubarskyi]
MSHSGRQVKLFQHLNQDVLLEIVEELWRTKNLRPLSLACRWLRDLCKPVLFSQAVVESGFMQSTVHEVFPPQSIWAYIRELTFRGPFQFSPGCSIHSGFPFDEVASWLQDAFQRMPRLDAILIKGTQYFGVPCLVLNAILRAPHLSSFKLAEPLVREESLGRDDLLFTITPALRHFWYTNADHYRGQPRRSQVEVQMVLSVLEQAPESLETLVLSSELILSFERLAARSWRKLRTLSLTGERPSQIPSRPLISVLACMPSLHTLVLDLAIPAGAGHEPVWPALIDGSLPWPDLRILSVAFPHPDDQIYSHLPSTLSSLRLRCWPRHYIHQSWPELGTIQVLQWRSPILSASELLRIVLRCASPRLDELDIEYKQDSDEMELLQALPAAFPNVTRLALYRYRQPGADDIDVAKFAEVLAAFKHLSVLRVHLDFVDQPHPLSTVHSPVSLFKMREAFARYGNIIASALASAKVVCFLDREAAFNKWYPFRIVADRMSEPPGPTYEQDINPFDARVRWLMFDPECD